MYIELNWTDISDAREEGCCAMFLPPSSGLVHTPSAICWQRQNACPSPDYQSRGLLQQYPVQCCSFSSSTVDLSSQSWTLLCVSSWKSGSTTASHQLYVMIFTGCLCVNELTTNCVSSSLNACISWLRRTCHQWLFLYWQLQHVAICVPQAKVICWCKDQNCELRP